MDIAKKQKISKLVIFLFLVIFPLGQLIRIPVLLLGNNVVIQPLDAVAAICFLFFLFDGFEIPEGLKKPFGGFLLAIVTSLLYGLTLFGFADILPGLLYFLRLFFYFGFFVVVYNFVKNSSAIARRLYLALIGLSLTIAIIGWVQYFVFPDLTALKYLGWDDHLYRLVGSFLDPGITSIFLVFGAILTIADFDKKKKWPSAALILFFLVSLAFSYSRAGYLAILASGLYIFWKFANLKNFIFLTAGFLLLLYFLPRPAGVGVKLERVFSISTRLQNYQQTTLIWSKSPLFGIGYNNLCLARQKYFASEPASHACSGSDNSILMLLATTGIVGLMIFVNLLVAFWRVVGKSRFSLAFRTSALAILVHSQFTNSLFYPWVLGFLAILLAISIKSSSSKTEM
jgi:O-antigen ligase